MCYTIYGVQKDTRANLIFLGVFLAISLPGAVILFKKKMDPAVPSMAMPDVALKRLPYNATRDAPDLERYVPDFTGEWVMELCQAHGVRQVMKEKGLPVMSNERHVQLVGAGKLIVWDDDVAKESDIELSMVGVGKIGVDKVEVAEVPTAVRKELIYAGFVQPPRRVAWVEFAMPGAEGNGNLRVKGGDFDDILTISAR
jgi:hypothetical protein